MTDNSTDFFFENVFPVLQANATQWGWPEGLEKEHFKPTHLNALSNMTYKVECTAEGNHIPILAKKFGLGFLQKLLSRQDDNKTSTLMGELGIGPKVLWFDEDHRVEEFVVAEMFTIEDMADKIQRRKLMYFVQKIHRTDVEHLSKDSLFDRCLDNSFPLIKLFEESIAQKKDQFSEEELVKIDKIRSLISPEEIEWIKSIYPKSPLVLSHNDFLNGNILKCPDGKFTLIDYEYATYNPRAFDLANFITESLFDYDFADHPKFKYHPEKRDGPEATRDLVKWYILYSCQKEDISQERAFELANSEELADAALLELFGGDQNIVDAKIDELVEEMDICVLLSQHLWAIWSVVVCKNPNIEFGYIQFGYERTVDYHNFKAKIYNN